MGKRKKILITGAKGFIGKNLIAQIRYKNDFEIYEFDQGNNPFDLDTFTRDCDIVIHLAGVNRPKSEVEFDKGNRGLTEQLINSLRTNNNKAPILFSSSTQAILDNSYGRSKLAAENVLLEYSKKSNTSVAIYRLPNIFGKWCKPEYNSVVATFCYNIANGLPVQINNRQTRLFLVYIDEVVKEFIYRALNLLSRKDFEIVENVFTMHEISLGELHDMIQSFREMRKKNQIPDLSNILMAELYATYLSYLPANELRYPLAMNVDDRGSFTEFIRTKEKGQFSVNISKPGIVKGNHWHHTKNEKFLVVSGKGIIRVRKIGTEKIVEYNVSDENLEVIDIPPGFTHNIENTGLTSLVTLIWASESFDKEKPDTIYEEV